MLVLVIVCSMFTIIPVSAVTAAGSIATVGATPDEVPSTADKLPKNGEYTELGIGEAKPVSIEKSRDEVWFRFSPTESVEVALFSITANDDLTSNADIMSESGIVVQRNINNYGYHPYFSAYFSAIAGEVYFIRCYAYPNQTGSYQIALVMKDFFNFDIYEDGTVTLSDYLGDETELTLPSDICGIPVTAVSKDFFKSSNYDEWCYNEETGEYRNNYIEYNADRLETLSIPISFTAFDPNVLRYCNSIKTLNLPSSLIQLKTLEYTVENLQEINVAPDNSYYQSESGIVYSKDGKKLIRYPSGKKGSSFTINKNIEEISEYAFGSCNNLENVIALNPDLKIGNCAFCNCTNLKSFIVENDGLVSPEKEADAAQPEKNKIDTDTKKKIAASVCFVYLDKQQQPGTGPAIDEAEKDIGQSAFSYCTALETVILSPRTKSIGSYAFFCCRSLTSVTLPNSVTSIGNGTFDNCSSLTSVTIPDSVASIGERAYYDCNGLTSVMIPSSVITIGKQAFGYHSDEDWNPAKVDSFTIYGYTGTEAERYANDNGFTFIALDAVDTSKVTITKTDIKADSVFNNDGYGSLRKNAVYDGYRIEAFPQSALIDSNGDYLFAYKDTWHRYYVSDGVVSLCNDSPYTKYCLRYYEEETNKWTEYDDPVGFYKLNGELLGSGNYWGVTPLSDGYAFVFEETKDYELKSYLIDKTGQVILELRDGFCQSGGFGEGGFEVRQRTLSMAGWFSEGLLPCWSYETVKDLYAGNCKSVFYMDVNGKTLFTLDPSDIETFWEFYGGLAGIKLKSTGKVGFIDKTGEFVIPCEYDSFGPFNDGLAYVSKDGKYGYINTKNEVVIPFAYDAAFGAGSGLASVGKGGKYGLVDYNNNIVVPFEYDDISSFEGGAAYAVKDGYVYIITEKAEQEPVLLGDADGDEQVTILDATAIQRHLVKLPTESFNEGAADADGDGEITILDATAIQRYLVKLPTNDKIGKPV